MKVNQTAPHTSDAVKTKPQLAQPKPNPNPLEHKPQQQPVRKESAHAAAKTTEAAQPQENPSQTQKNVESNKKPTLLDEI